MKTIQKILMALLLGLTAVFFVFHVDAADRSALIVSRAALVSAIADEAEYEPNSFAAFSDAIDLLGGLAAIDAMIADDLATQPQVDALHSQLEDALAGLVYLSTYNNAEDAYDAAFVLASDLSFTLNSRTNLQTSLTAARLILDEPTSGQAAIADLEIQLLDLPDLLVSQALMDALTLRNNLAINFYYEVRNSYTVSSHSAFRAAVDAYGGYLSVHQLMDKPDVTESELQSQIDAIEAAILLLDLKGDTVFLEDAYEAALDTPVTAFIPASVVAFQAELQRIYLLLLSNDANQAAIDDAYADLMVAPDLLIPFADKTALTVAIREAKDLKEERYTVTSYYQLRVLLTEADTLVENPDALQSEVDQMILDLNETVLALVSLPEEVELTVGKTGVNLSAYVTLGDSTIVGYESSDPDVATVDGAGNVTPVKFGTTLITITLANGVEEVLEIFVKEKVKPLTMILLGGIPAVSIGTGIFMVLLSKSRPAEIIQRVRKNQKKNKKHISESKNGLTETK